MCQLFGQVFVQRSVHSVKCQVTCVSCLAKCLLSEVSVLSSVKCHVSVVWPSVCSAKCLICQVSSAMCQLFGQVFVQRSVHSVKCQSAKCLLCLGAVKPPSELSSEVQSVSKQACFPSNSHNKFTYMNTKPLFLKRFSVSCLCTYYI